MALTLIAPVESAGFRERNRLGISKPGASPQIVAEALLLALQSAGIEGSCFRNKHGFGDNHDQWDVTVGGAVFDEILVLENERLAKMSQRSRDEFAKHPVRFGVFVRAEREDASKPWGPCEVTIYYTLKGRPLTAFKKHLMRAVQIVDPGVTG